jgi:hypothetical protein
LVPVPKFQLVAPVIAVPALILSPPPTIEAAENVFALITNAPNNNSFFYLHFCFVFF